MSEADAQVTLVFSEATKAAREVTTTSGPLPPTSLPGRIGQLEVGQTCSESQFLDFDTTSRAAFDQSVKALRSTMSKAAARAASRTGHTYITVTGDHRTRDGDLIVVATAVRTA